MLTQIVSLYLKIVRIINIKHKASDRFDFVSSITKQNKKKLYEFIYVYKHYKLRYDMHQQICVASHRKFLQNFLFRIPKSHDRVIGVQMYRF